MTDTLNPIWNQTFDFMVEDALHDLLMVEVWDHDTFGKVHSVSCILFVHLKSKIPYLDSLWLHNICANLSLCYSFKGVCFLLSRPYKQSGLTSQRKTVGEAT